MEDTLRAMNNFSVTGYICLNPCFNGRYSQSLFETLVDRLRKVLILVLMEDTLRVISNFANNTKGLVLILVLMEDTLRERQIRCR